MGRVGLVGQVGLVGVRAAPAIMGRVRQVIVRSSYSVSIVFL
ncbi:hypothetical protein [Capnocytophaga leadbetteri]|nr:hypothetical protein [Capnocytophaga leadbetteri]